MSQNFSIKLDSASDHIRVSGELTFTTATKLLDESVALFESLSLLDIDLSEVTRSDSAGLALLIAWIRSANTASKKIVFHNIPTQMLAIANASGLDELLPLQ